MAQFELYRLKDGQFVVDLQTDLIGIKASRVVAPLREADRYMAFPGLTPSVEVEGATWIVRVQESAAVPGTELREQVGSLSEHLDAPKRALDILIEGDRPGQAPIRLCTGTGRPRFLAPVSQASRAV